MAGAPDRMRSALQFAGSEALARLPALFFLVLIVAIVTQQGNQVDYLFRAYDVTKGMVMPVIVTIVCGALFLLLVNTNMRQPALLDFPLYAAPPGLLTAKAFLQDGPAVTFVACAFVAAVSLLTYVAISRLRHRVRSAYLLALTGWGVSLITLSAAVIASPVEAPLLIGAIATVVAFVGLLVAGLRLILGIPGWGPVAICLLAVWGLTGENEHAIEKQTLTDDAGEHFNVTQQNRIFFWTNPAFAQWLVSRRDLVNYYQAGKSYPVLLVGSEGGGGYAAAHSYTFLSKLQARCPNFLQHTFALIGVSGGAVGNSMAQATFADEANTQSPQGCAAAGGKTAKPFPNLDLLSPVIATMLFRDFPNRFVRGAFGSYDRSDALADTVRTIWSDRSYDPYYLNHFWRLDARKSMLSNRGGPAVINVATNVTNGSRYLFSPFVNQFNYGSGRFEEYLSDLNEGLEPVMGESIAAQGPRPAVDVKFFDTAMTSAAFPWMSPSRYLSTYLDGANVALVDGGYFEGTGAETVADLYSELAWSGTFTYQLSPDTPVEKLMIDRGCRQIVFQLDSSIHTPKPDVPSQCVVRFSLYSILIRTNSDVSRFVAARQNFFTDPVTTMLGTRGQRSRDAMMTLLDRMCANCGAMERLEYMSEGNLLESVMNPTDLSLPLGWTMPASSIALMQTVVVPNDPVDFKGVSNIEDLSQILDNQRNQNFASVEKLAKILEKP